MTDAIALYKAANMVDMIQKVRETQAFHVVAKSDPKEAKRIMLDCCNHFEESGEYLYQAYTYAKLAMLSLDEGKPDEAGRFLEIMENENKKHGLLPETHHLWAYMFRVLARYHLETNNLGQAIKYSHNSGHIFDTIGLRKEAAKSLQVAVDAEVKKGDHKAALETSQKALGILQNEGGV